MSLPIVLVSGFLIMLALILVYLILSRDPEVQRVRWGLFMERKRYPKEELPEEETQAWPDREEKM